jgi:hypothetical protein
VTILWGVCKVEKGGRGLRDKEEGKPGERTGEGGKISFYSHKRQSRNFSSIYIYIVQGAIDSS